MKAGERWGGSDGGKKGGGFMKGDRLCPQVSRLWFMKGKDASQADDGHRVEDGGAAIVSPTPSSDSVTRAWRITVNSGAETRPP